MPNGPQGLRIPSPEFSAYYYLLYLRDEEGNMQAIPHTTLPPKAPMIIGFSQPRLIYAYLDRATAQKHAQELRTSFSNALHGLELVILGDEDQNHLFTIWKATEAFQNLPSLQGNDAEIPRKPLERIVPTWVEIEHSHKQAREKATEQPRCRNCMWSGPWSEIEQWDWESKYCIDWTCRSCGKEQVFWL